MEKLVTRVEDVLQSMSNQRQEGKGDAIEAEMFVGRVALYLARQSEFLTDLSGEAGIDLGEFPENRRRHAAHPQRLRKKLWSGSMPVRSFVGGRNRRKRPLRFSRRCFILCSDRKPFRARGRVSSRRRAQESH